MVLRCVAPSKLVPPSISDSRALRLALLSRGADRDRRLVQMWRAVVKLQVEPNTEDSPVLHPRTRSCFTRFLSQRSGDTPLIGAASGIPP